MLSFDDVVHDGFPGPFAHFRIGVRQIEQTNFAVDVWAGNSGLVLMDHQPLSLRAIFCLQTLAQFCLRVLAVEHASAVAQLDKRETFFCHGFHNRKRGSD